MQIATKLYRIIGMIAMLALMAVSMTMAPAAAAKGKSDNTGSPNAECPAGTTLVAKFNYNGGGYSFEKPAGNENVVTITNADANGGSFTSTVYISAVIVKGGSGGDATKTVVYDPAVLAGSFDNSGLLNKAGKVPAISNIQFCGGEEPPPPPDCCLEAYNITLASVGNEIVADVAVWYTDGYIPDNVDVTVEWTTPGGTITQTVNTSGDNVATFSIPAGGPGTYTIKVTGADGFDGTPFCGTVSASISL